MRRYCVRCCLFDGLTDCRELFALLEFIALAGGIERAWLSDGSIWIDLAASADCVDNKATVVWCAGFAGRMKESGFNAVAAPCQL